MSEDQSNNQDTGDTPQESDPPADTPDASGEPEDSPQASDSPVPEDSTDAGAAPAGGSGATAGGGGDAGGSSDADSRAFDLPELHESTDGPGEMGGRLDLLSDVDLNVKIELGRTRMFVEDVLKLNQGSVVELDKLAGDPVDIFVNECLVARGEVLVLNDNFCVRVNELVSSKHSQGRRKSA